MAGVTRIAILGGGPGGYEAALVAAQLGAEVTVVDRDGLGGSAVLTDCVPSKTLVATAEAMTDVGESAELGVVVDKAAVAVDLARVNTRVKALADAQSRDVAGSLEKAGVQVVSGTGRLAPGDRVVVDAPDGTSEEFVADVALISTGRRSTTSTSYRNGWSSSDLASRERSSPAPTTRSARLLSSSPHAIEYCPARMPTLPTYSRTSSLGGV